MLGFSARASSKQELRPDGEEIARLRWFSKQELVAQASKMLLPGPATISRAMIELWLGQKISSASENLSNGQQ
jgi:NAD+ diphosphatase